jgi:hypothetical protein
MTARHSVPWRVLYLQLRCVSLTFTDKSTGASSSGLVYAGGFPWSAHARTESIANMNHPRDAVLSGDLLGMRQAISEKCNVDEIDGAMTPLLWAIMRGILQR